MRSDSADVHSGGQDHSELVIVCNGKRYFGVPERAESTEKVADQTFTAGQHVEVRIDSGLESSSSSSDGDSDDEDHGASGSKSDYASAIVTRDSEGGGKVYVQWYYRRHEIPSSMSVPRREAKLQFLCNSEDTVDAACIVRVHAGWLAREKVASHLYDAGAKELVNAYCEVLDYKATRDHAQAALARVPETLRAVPAVYIRAACDAVEVCLNVPNMAHSPSREAMASFVCFGPFAVGVELVRLIACIRDTRRV